MRRNQRLGIAAAAIVVIVVAFLVLRPQNDNSSDGTVPATATTSTTTGSATKPRSSARPAEAHIVVVGGKPEGGVHQLKFKHNQTIRIAVTSDVADEVHVHGYDLKQDVPKGGTVHFAFPGRIEGIFEIELENAKQQLSSFEVTP